MVSEAAPQGCCGGSQGVSPVNAVDAFGATVTLRCAGHWCALGWAEGRGWIGVLGPTTSPVSHSPAAGVAVLPLGDIPLPPQHHSLERSVREKRNGRSLWCSGGWSTSPWQGFWGVWEAGIGESFAILCSPTPLLGFAPSHTQDVLAPALRSPLL